MGNTLIEPQYLLGLSGWRVATSRGPGSNPGRGISVGWTNGRYAMRLISRTGRGVSSLNCDRCRLWSYDITAGYKCEYYISQRLTLTHFWTASATIPSLAMVLAVVIREIKHWIISKLFHFISHVTSNHVWNYFSHWNYFKIISSTMNMLENICELQ